MYENRLLSICFTACFRLHFQFKKVLQKFVAVRLSKASLTRRTVKAPVQQPGSN